MNKRLEDWVNWILYDELKMGLSMHRSICLETMFMAMDR